MKDLTLKSIGLVSLALSLLIFSSCKEEDNPAPLAEASFDYVATTDIVGQAPLNVIFTNSSVNAVTYAWDFGDGTTSTDEAPAHTYSSGGVYTVKLTVTNVEEVEAVDQFDVELSSPLVGTWVLDSAAENTIDTLATVVTGAMEFGDREGWDGSNWLAIADEAAAIKGYSTFWSNVIFSGSYLGRKTFFNNEFTFTVDGKYQRELNGSMPGVVYFSPESDDLSESEDWKNADGGSLNAYKSNADDYSYGIVASADYADKNLGELTLSGTGAWAGIYFAGNAIGATPQDEYVYTISRVTDTELVLTGVNNLFGNDAVIFVLKFKKK